MGNTVQIHLSKPGGRMEGPYTLEQIKQDLSAKKYRDTDYWAWHTGLPEWMPLYELPGIARSEVPAAPAPAAAVAREPAKPAAAPAQVRADSSVAAPAAAAVPKPQAKVAAAKPPAQAPTISAPKVVAGEVEEEPVPLHRQLSSGMPFSSLEQLFIFTTGQGPLVWESETAVRMFHAVIGEELSTIRAYTPRDVISDCDPSDLLGREGSLSDSVWRAMTSRQPELVQQARTGVHRICVRTFRIEDGSVVALVLFYNKHKG